MKTLVNTDYVKCIEACQACAIDCELCLTTMVGVESQNDCPLCCYECIESCLQCVRALVRRSNFTELYCKLCAEICEWCAKQCEEHDMDHCQRCAISCRHCANECRTLVGQL